MWHDARFSENALETGLRGAGNDKRRPRCPHEVNGFAHHRKTGGGAIAPDGVDVRQLPLRERKAALTRVDDARCNRPSMPRASILIDSFAVVVAALKHQTALAARR